MFQMDITGGDEGMDAGPFCFTNSFPGKVNIIFAGSRKTCNSWAFHSGGNCLDGSEIPWGSGGEAGFDDVYFQTG